MFQKLKVADVMTRQVSTVLEEDSLEQVLSVLRPYRFRHVPVVDGTRVVGMLSHRDLLQLTTEALDRSPAARARRVRALDETFVRDLMNTNVVTIGPDASLSEAARLMHQQRVGALPVVDERQNLLGILSEADLVRSLVHLL